MLEWKPQPSTCPRVRSVVGIVNLFYEYFAFVCVMRGLFCFTQLEPRRDDVKDDAQDP